MDGQKQSECGQVKKISPSLTHSSHLSPTYIHRSLEWMGVASTSLTFHLNHFAPASCALFYSSPSWHLRNLFAVVSMRG